MNFTLLHLSNLMLHCLMIGLS